jgi:hypothetical protein
MPLLVTVVAARGEEGEVVKLEVRGGKWCQPWRVKERERWMRGVEGEV